MALKACPECGHKISTTAKSCPNCGFDVAAKNALNSCGCLALFLVFLVVGVAVLIGLTDSLGRDSTRARENATGSPLGGSSRQSGKVLYAKRIDNIRTGPGTGYKILLKTIKLEKLTYEKKEGNWYKLRRDAGEPAAWVHDSIVYTKREGEKILEQRREAEDTENANIIGTFLASHREFGDPGNAEFLPDWAHGRRYRMSTTKGTYVFYLHESEGVVGVRDNRNRSKSYFHKDIPELPKNVKREADGEVPDYEILFQVETGLGRGRTGIVLVPILSRTTPTRLRESIIRAIAHKEGFRVTRMYATRDAYKADGSQSYLDKHPNAIKEGFLGTIEESGKFRSGEVFSQSDSP